MSFVTNPAHPASPLYMMDETSKNETAKNATEAAASGDPAVGAALGILVALAIVAAVIWVETRY